ncbi:MAG: glycosyltransferase family 2 protein [Lachnospiraceae bacterium]|nr:glycosyltransferase family 2 protein [Lachnospiraceae bacterium]
MRVLIIIPAYNEEDSIVDVIDNLKETNEDVDYVVINDCSKDGTRKLLLEKKLNHISLPQNLGIGGAVQSGYIYAREHGYDIAIQMDGDGQHPAEEITKLVDPIMNGEADMVVGSRFVTKDGFQSTALRRFGIKFLSGLIKMRIHQRIYDVTSGFRAVNVKGIELFSNNYAQDYPEPESLITAAKFGLRICEVPVMMKERQGGVSSISSFKSVYYMIKVSLAILLGGNY